MRALALALMFALGAAPQSAPRKKRPAATAKPAVQPPPETPGELKEYPIASLSVEGNQIYTAAAIIAASGLKVGDRANKELFEAARDRLLATGAFDSVGYRYFNAADGRSYDAVWQVVEVLPVYPWRLEGVNVDLDALSEHLRRNDPLYGDRIAPTQASLERRRQLINAFLKSHAIEPSEVLGKVESDAPGKLEIVFRPASGMPVVAGVQFTGNQAIPTAQLKPAIDGVAVGVPYEESRFRQLLASSVKPLYERRGRLNVTFPAITVKPSERVKGLDVEVTVNEGDVFQLGEVKLQGPPALPERELRRAANFDSGDVANLAAVQEGLERMRNYLRRLGYIMAVVSADRSIDVASKRLHLSVLVDPGDQYAFGKLFIEGLDIHSEPVIRKMWALKEGQPYNADYAANFLRRIEEEQIFENLGKTAVKELPDAERKIVNVTLIFGAAAQPKSILKP
jgi:outer membrane protein insertion porin family